MAQNDNARDVKINVRYITLERAEGLIEDCCKPITVKTWLEADNVLSSWSCSAPKGGAYDKCDFVITFTDGKTYSGRYDLHNEPEKNETLQTHVLEFLRFYSGVWQPDHVSDEAYADILKRAREFGTYDSSVEYLNKYNFED